jgi:hypothetical protein
MRTDDVPERLPLDAGPPTDAGHITVHAVLVRGADATFEGSIRGPSDVEAGMEPVSAEEEVPQGERWWLAWVAVTHEPDGARGYRGVAAAGIVVDPIARKSFRDRERHSAMLEIALRGGVELTGLAGQERAALRKALLHQDPDAWDRAPESLRTALESGEPTEEAG